jgi:hypothetical protein
MRGIQDVLLLAAGGSYLLVVELQESASSDLHNDHWIRARIIGSRRANRIASIIANKRKYNYKHRTVVFHSTHYLNKPEVGEVDLAPLRASLSAGCMSVVRSPSALSFSCNSPSSAYLQRSNIYHPTEPGRQHVAFSSPLSSLARRTL